MSKNFFSKEVVEQPAKHTEIISGKKATDFDFDRDLRERYSEPKQTGIISDLVNNHKFKKHYGEFSATDAEALSPQERQVVKDYTYNGFREMNRLLYSSERCNFNASDMLRIREKIDALTNLLDKRSLEQQGIFYRGLDSGTTIFGSDIFKMSLNSLREKYQGKVYVNQGFSSVSFSRKVAESFSGGVGGVLLDLRIPKGARALCVGASGTFGAAEREVILQRGTSFTIDRIDFRDGKFRVKMTAVGVAK